MKRTLLVIPFLLTQANCSSSIKQLSQPTQTIHHHKIKSNPKETYVIGAEITNTDVNIGIFHVQENKPKLCIEFRTKSTDIKDINKHLQEITDRIQKDHNVSASSACFAVPGISKGDLFLHPHLPWNTSDDVNEHTNTAQRGINKQKIAMHTGLSNIYFVNDFQAVAIGSQNVAPSNMITLQQGEHISTKPKLVIGAGNGLGVCLLVWDVSLNSYIPMQLNYSFTEYGAQNDLEFAFFKYLKNTTGNIAWGKVLGAGAGGIKLMYNFFNDYDASKKSEEQQYKHDSFVDHKDLHYLDIFGKYRTSKRCHDTVEFFVAQFARIIRNAAYAQNALGGVYIMSTAYEKVPHLLNSDKFLQQITNLEGLVIEKGSKDYLESYLKRIPFYLLTDPKIQIYGAAALCIEPNLIRN